MILVQEGERLVGVVSDRDLLKVLRPLNGEDQGNANQGKFRERLFATEANDSLLGKKLNSLMASDPFSTTPETSLLDAIATLLDKRISCLPVVDPDRRVCGVFTATDVLRVTYAILNLSCKKD